MKTKHVFLLTLALSALYTGYTVYTTPVLSLPARAKSPSVSQDSGKDTPTPTPLPRLDDSPTPTVTQAKGKATPVKGSKGKATPTLAHKDTLAARMERANKIIITADTHSVYTTTVSKGCTLPLYSVQRTPTPAPYVNRDSVTRSRLVLPVLSVGKNHGVRYNGKDTIKANQNQGKAK